MARLLKSEYIADIQSSHTDPLILREGAVLASDESPILEMDKRQLRHRIGADYDFVIDSTLECAGEMLEIHFKLDVPKSSREFVFRPLVRAACFAMLDSVGAAALENSDANSVMSEPKVVEEVLKRTGDPNDAYRNLTLDDVALFEPTIAVMVSALFKSQKPGQSRLLSSSKGMSWVSRYDKTPHRPGDVRPVEYIYTMNLIEQ